MQRRHSVSTPTLIQIETDYSSEVSKTEPSSDLRSARIDEYLQARSLDNWSRCVCSTPCGI